MSNLTGYAATYASPGETGTFRFQLDVRTGRLSGRELVYRQTNTKYAAWSGGLLAAVTESGGQAGAALLDTRVPGTPLLDRQLTERTTACFLTWHGGLLYSANYHDGHVLIYAVEDGRLKLVRRVEMGLESGCHQVIFHDRWALVPCLRLDRVNILDREDGFRQAGAISFPQGTGPRHGVFAAGHRRFYLVSERSNQLFTYAVDGPEFTLEGVVPVLPPDFSGKAEAAAIRLSEDQRTLYISVRGADLISVFRLGGGLPELLQHAGSMGRDPWDILPVPGGSLMLVSNRGSGTLLCRRLEADGQLGAQCGDLAIPQCVGLALEQQPRLAGQGA